jgi:hypothetical protein
MPFVASPTASCRDWQSLSRLTAGAAFDIERVRLIGGQDVAIEGRFEVPPLARLSAEDQTFVAAFVRCHGSIKQVRWNPQRQGIVLYRDG